MNLDPDERVRSRDIWLRDDDINVSAELVVVNRVSIRSWSILLSSGLV